MSKEHRIAMFTHDNRRLTSRHDLHDEFVKVYHRSGGVSLPTIPLFVLAFDPTYSLDSGSLGCSSTRSVVVLNESIGRYLAVSLRAIQAGRCRIIFK